MNDRTHRIWWGKAHRGGRSGRRTPAARTRRSAVRSFDIVGRSSVQASKSRHRSLSPPAPFILPSHTHTHTHTHTNLRRLLFPDNPPPPTHTHTLDGTSVRYSAGMIWSVSMLSLVTNTLPVYCRGRSRNFGVSCEGGGRVVLSNGVSDLGSFALPCLPIYASRRRTDGRPPETHSRSIEPSIPLFCRSPIIYISQYGCLPGCEGPPSKAPRRPSWPRPPGGRSARRRRPAVGGMWISRVELDGGGV